MTGGGWLPGGRRSRHGTTSAFQNKRELRTTRWVLLGAPSAGGGETGLQHAGGADARAAGLGLRRVVHVLVPLQPELCPGRDTQLDQPQAAARRARMRMLRTHILRHMRTRAHTHTAQADWGNGPSPASAPSSLKNATLTCGSCVATVGSARVWLRGCGWAHCTRMCVRVRTWMRTWAAR